MGCTPETCVTLDHWSELLAAAFRARGMAVPKGPEGHLQVNRSLIMAFRERFGMGKWLNLELDELDAFETQFGASKEKNAPKATLIWEDVSEDGSSDIQWEKFTFAEKKWTPE